MHSYEEVQTPLKDVIFAPVIFHFVFILEHFFFDNCGLHKTHLLRNVLFYASAVRTCDLKVLSIYSVNEGQVTETTGASSI